MGSLYHLFWRKDPILRRIFVICVLTDVALASLVPFVNLYMSDELKAPSEITGLAFGGYLAVETLFKAPAGALSDRWGRKTVLMGGLAIGVLAASLMGLCQVHSLFLFLFPLAGLSVAAVFPAMAALMADHTVEAERSTVMGVLNLSYNAGLAVSAAGGFFVHELVGTYRFNFFGTALALTLALVLAGLLLSSHQPVGGIGPAKTGNWKRIPLKALSPPLLTLAAIMGLSQFGLAMLVPIVVPFAKKVVHLSDTSMGIGIVAATTIWAIASVPLARFSDRFGREEMIKLALLLGAVCFFCVPIIADLGLSLALLPVALLAGSAWLLAFPAALALGSELVSDNEKGTAVGLIYGGQGVGAALGAPTGGFFHKAVYLLTRDEPLSLTVPFVASGLILLMAFVTSFFLSRQIRSWLAASAGEDPYPQE
ncbi:MAG: MFS transporter [Armatimonadetes bacterium]|nr:MFS transporter [Armatimonadota bacterium]MDW8120930.1 MFS transporter [Armatimonadota bacterium]